MATRVSWGFADITISFDMETPKGASARGGPVKWQGERVHSAGVAEDTALCMPRRAAQEEPEFLLHGFLHPMRSSINSKTVFPAGGCALGAGTET
jgi:hypothetical protein